jgi:hypothetical protein
MEKYVYQCLKCLSFLVTNPLTSKTYNFPYLRWTKKNPEINQLSRQAAEIKAFRLTRCADEWLKKEILNKINKYFVIFRENNIILRIIFKKKLILFLEVEKFNWKFLNLDTRRHAKSADTVRSRQPAEIVTSM